MNKLISAIVVVALSGCGGVRDGADGFRNGVPNQSTVALNVPSSSASQPLSGVATKQDKLEGDRASFYEFTRGVTVLVNTGVAATLILVEKIVESPPTSVTAKTATWGPWTDALSPNTWKMTVTKTGDAAYSYALEGRGKTEADSAFRVVLSGTHTSTGDKLGSGTFLIDWDALAQLPEHDANVGTASMTYSKTSASAEVNITAVFTNVRDTDTGNLISSTYTYTEHPGNGGSLDFSANKNFFGGAALETLTVRSRWAQSGAGRADVQATGGDLTAAATINECWDSNFASRYLLASYQTAGNYGAPSVCAFSSPEYVTP